MKGVVRKEVKEIYFHEYRKMIEKAAWVARSKWKMDIHDLRSQAYLIFCDAVDRYDENRGASFGTFLFNRLRTLNDYCVKEVKKRNAIDPYSFIFGDFVIKISFEVDKKKTKLINENPREKERDVISDTSSLSNDAKEIINFIISRDWEDVEGRSSLPSFHSIKSIYNKKWKPKRIKKAWEEAKWWWEDNF